MRFSLIKASRYPQIWESLACLKNEEWGAADIGYAISRGDLTAVGMFDDEGELAGFGLVQLHGNPSGSWLHDAHVWVFPEHRRSGFYSGYISFLREWAARDGLLGVKCIVKAGEDEDIWRNVLVPLGGRARTIEYVFDGKGAS